MSHNQTLLAQALCLCLLVALGGCTTAQYAKGVVNAYCGLDQSARSVNREAVALAVAPNRIHIECAGDAR